MIHKSQWYIIFGVGIFSAFLCISVFKLDTVPPAWGDEGWTLSVARNWVKLGHYGHLLNGQPRGPGLNAAFPVVAPIALSFRIFGVGVWQGRLPSVLYLLGSLTLIFYLADRLYNHAIAIGSLFVLFFLSGPLQLHPLTLGRTVLAEMPMLFYLLAGYALLLLALRKSSWLILPAALLWSVAINTKAQALPFWLASLLLPLGITAIKRWWQQAGLLLASLLLAWLAAEGTQSMVKIIIPELSQAEPIPGLVQVVALVLEPEVRRIAITVVLTLGLPTLTGFLYATWKSYKAFREQVNPDEVESLRLTLLGFVGSWLAWYITLALYFDRYLFPAVFVGSIFTSAFLYQLTFHFNFKRTLKNARAIFFRSRNRYNFGGFFALPLIVILSLITTQYLFRLYTKPSTSVMEVIQYIESNTDEDDLIETYESELFFLLNRRYHYPPDITSLEVIKRNLLNEEIPYTYDPFEEVNPDFLIIRNIGKGRQIYNGVLASGRFEKIKSFTNYSIYARVNE